MKNKFSIILFFLVLTVGTSAVAKNYDTEQVEILEQKLRNCREQLSPLKTELEAVKSELHRYKRQNMSDGNIGHDDFNEKTRLPRYLEEVRKENDKLKSILDQIDLELSQTDIQLMNSEQLKKKYSDLEKKQADYKNKLKNNKKFYWPFEKEVEIEWDPDFIALRIKETKKQIILLKYAIFLKENNYITYKDSL